MINRVYHTSALNISPAMNSGTAPAEATGSFASVYNRMQELHTAAANRTASPFAAQAVETAPSYSSVYAPGRGGVYAPRPAELDDPEATRKKLEELKADIMDKGASGFFDRMDDNESFAYLYERYSDAFGANFLDRQWQSYAYHGSPTQSDLAKSEVISAFHLHLDYAQFDLFDTDIREQWYGRTKSDAEKSAIRETRSESFAAYFGYGDMTPEERYQAILSDYHASGDGSYASTFKMLYLLKETGAADKNAINEAMTLLRNKMDSEYASLDMTVVDMAKSRYANSFYGFDAAAYLLGMVDYIQHAKENSIVFNYDPQTIASFEKLTADLQALSGAGGIL